MNRLTGVAGTVSPSLLLRANLLFFGAIWRKAVKLARAKLFHWLWQCGLARKSRRMAEENRRPLIDTLGRNHLGRVRRFVKAR